MDKAGKMNPYVRGYLLQGIEGTPDTLRGLLHTLPAGDPRWDAVPDPQRFSLRGVLAHLADYEDVMAERFGRMLAENHPTLPDWDPGAAATEGGYDSRDPFESLSKIAESRPALVSRLRELPPESWLRTALREGVGDVTVEELLALMLFHDAYHLRQAAQWVQLTAEIT
jgi:hypothetical protein